MASARPVVLTFPKSLPLLLLLLCAALGACAPLIAEYNAEAYKNATTLKAETLAMMDKSGEPYSRHRKDVDTLTTKINAAYEYSAGFASNQLSAQQWNILRNPDGNLYGSFVRLWQARGTLGAGYRSEKQIDIAEAFDYLICLEANKREPRPCSAAGARTARGPQ
jgi:hypothetical protein